MRWKYITRTGHWFEVALDPTCLMVGVNYALDADCGPTGFLSGLYLHVGPLIFGYCNMTPRA